MQSDARPRIFLDSNVIFSGLYSASGAPGSILSGYIEGKLRVVISQQVLEEVVRTVERKHIAALPLLKRILVNVPPEIVEDPKPEEVALWDRIMDSEDASILAAAIAAQPDYLVTGDRRFFENAEIINRTGLRIVTPAQFLKIWK